MALSGTNDRFCASWSMSHLYENNTGMSWSCNGSDYRICKTNWFSYGNSRLYVWSVMGEWKKWTLVTLDVLNFPFNKYLQIQAGNYSRPHGMIQLVEWYWVSSDGKKSPSHFHQISMVLWDNTLANHIYQMNPMLSTSQILQTENT